MRALMSPHSDPHTPEWQYRRKEEHLEIDLSRNKLSFIFLGVAIDSIGSRAITADQIESFESLFYVFR